MFCLKMAWLVSVFWVSEAGQLSTVLLYPTRETSDSKPSCTCCKLRWDPHIVRWMVLGFVGMWQFQPSQGCWWAMIVYVAVHTTKPKDIWLLWMPQLWTPWPKQYHQILLYLIKVMGHYVIMGVPVWNVIGFNLRINLWSRAQDCIIIYVCNHV